MRHLCGAPTWRSRYRARCRRLVAAPHRRCPQHRCDMPPGPVTTVCCGLPRYHLGGHGAWYVLDAAYAGPGVPGPPAARRRPCALRSGPLEYACPACGAAAGSPCRSTGGPRAGEPRQNFCGARRRMSGRTR